MVDERVGGGWWILSEAEPTDLGLAVEVTGQTIGVCIAGSHTARLYELIGDSLLRQPGRVLANLLRDGWSTIVSR
jgi:hypothetical protein